VANLNKVILIGRLTRDPESRAAGSSKVCRIGFAVTNRKKNTQTGNWEDDPMFIDVEVWNGREGGPKTADLVQDRCRKGTQIMVEGRLVLDKWQDKTTGQERQKHKIVADNIQLLDPRTDGGGSAGGNAGGNRAPARSGQGYSAPPEDDGGMSDEPPPGNGGGGSDGEIPF
jgi:single-strand DNA-binding protein